MGNRVMPLPANERLSVQDLHRKFLDALNGGVASHSEIEAKPLEVDLRAPLPHRLRVYMYNATYPPSKVSTCSAQGAAIRIARSTEIRSYFQSFILRRFLEISDRRFSDRSTCSGMPLVQRSTHTYHNELERIDVPMKPCRAASRRHFCRSL